MACEYPSHRLLFCGGGMHPHAGQRRFFAEGGCAMVSWPLASLLEMHGVPCAITCCKLPDEAHAVQHVWIELSDGRVLDATADQFNRRGQDPKHPPVYLGKPLAFHKGEALLIEETA